MSDLAGEEERTESKGNAPENSGIEPSRQRAPNVALEKDRLDVELKRLDIAARKSALLRYVPIAQISVSLATLAVAVIAFLQVQRPLSLLQIETAQRERQVNIPRASPKLSLSCEQQSPGKIVDSNVRFLCNAGVAYTNTGAGPFKVRKVTFRLYRGAPCFYVPGMSPDGDKRSGFERLLEARGTASLNGPTGPACLRGPGGPADGVARVATPTDPPGDIYWELADTVVSDRSGFNGISELNRDESGSASAGWLVVVPTWQYGYMAVEAEVAWSTEIVDVSSRKATTIESASRETSPAHLNWYLLSVSKLF